MKPVLTTLLLFSTAIAQPLTQDERNKAMSHLHATRKLFLDSVAGLSEAQWKFKPAPERWSIAECAEHIAVSEDTIFGMITEKILKGPATEKQAAPAERDEAIVKLMVDRSAKFKAPEMLQPSNRWATPEALLASYKASRDKTIAYVQTTQDELRTHAQPHPVLKSLDAYQWILLLSAHSERHTLQLNEVKTDPKYPK